MAVDPPELTAADFGGSSDELRDREKRLAAVKATEERGMERSDGGKVRLTFSYTAEQAAVVRAVLGPDPGAKLYEICRDLG